MSLCYLTRKEFIEEQEAKELETSVCQQQMICFKFSYSQAKEFTSVILATLYVSLSVLSAPSDAYDVIGSDVASLQRQNPKVLKTICGDVIQKKPYALLHFQHFKCFPANLKKRKNFQVRLTE